MVSTFSVSTFSLANFRLAAQYSLWRTVASSATHIITILQSPDNGRMNMLALSNERKVFSGLKLTLGSFETLQAVYMPCFSSDLSGLTTPGEGYCGLEFPPFVLPVCGLVQSKLFTDGLFKLMRISSRTATNDYFISRLITDYYFQLDD